MADVRIFTTDQEGISVSVPFEAEIVEVERLDRPRGAVYDIPGWPPYWTGAPQLASRVARLRTQRPDHRILLGLADANLLVSPEVAEVVELANDAGVGADIFIEPADE